MQTPTPNLAVADRSSPLEILWVFLRLGLTSFGGPVAHLGYFRTEFVERRRWMDERSYADLVALCQFLPGPASSQVGIAVGMARGGWLGSLAAWAGFTLPSALVLIVFALALSRHGEWADSGVLHGLKVVAVAVVAQAVWGMAKSLCPDRPRAALAIGAALLTLLLPSAFAQVGAIVVCGLIGRVLLELPGQQAVEHRTYGVSRPAGAIALALFTLLLLGLPLLAVATSSPILATLDAFYRAGALVFGGGHVVLPLLQSAVVPSGAVGNAQFLAGYGAAQAVPGPLFTFAAYLGAVMQPAVAGIGGWLGGLACLLAIFTPAWLLVVGALPFWDGLRQRPAVQSALAGVNAAVVGILLAALYDPVWTSAIRSRADFGLALAAFGLLVTARLSPLLVVALSAAAGWAMSAI
ncbi:MAG: chromate efflux transporter [Burkholderiaceae bacterium]|nr:chromate efflux transporter [Burkholderiaceae bacterium]